MIPAGGAGWVSRFSQIGEFTGPSSSWDHQLRHAAVWVCSLSPATHARLTFNEISMRLHPFGYLQLKLSCFPSPNMLSLSLWFAVSKMVHVQICLSFALSKHSSSEDAEQDLFTSVVRLSHRSWVSGVVTEESWQKCVLSRQLNLLNSTFYALSVHSPSGKSVHLYSSFKIPKNIQYERSLAYHSVAVCIN